MVQWLLHEDAEAAHGIALRNPDEGCNDVLPCGQLCGDACPVSEPMDLEPDRSVPFAPLVGHLDTAPCDLPQMISPTDPIDRDTQRVDLPASASKRQGGAYGCVQHLLVHRNANLSDASAAKKRVVVRRRRRPTVRSEPAGYGASTVG